MSALVPSLHPGTGANEMTARQSSALLHQKSYPMVRKYQLRSPLERRTWVIVHRSLLPGHCSSKVCETGGLGSCACFAVGCGCAMADGVQGRGAASLGKCRRGYRSGLATRQDRICSHSPSKGSCLRTSPAQGAFSLFLLSVLGMEAGCRAGNAPLDGNVSYCTMFN